VTASNSSRATGPRRNEQIRSSAVRVVDATGTMLGEMDASSAIAMARDLGLDLVEVSPGAVPVCKIYDYAKEKFRTERITRATAHRNSTKMHISEVQLRVMIGDNDLLTKARTADRALGKQQRVRVIVILHGRLIARPEMAADVLARFYEKLEHPMEVESTGGTERRITVMLRPVAAAHTD
jgi:translation initiation factor IF-3